MYVEHCSTGTMPIIGRILRVICADVQQNKAGNPWQPTTYWASFSLDKIYFEILTYKSTLSIYQYKLSNNMKTIE